MTSPGSAHVDTAPTAAFGKGLVLLCSVYAQGIGMGLPAALSVMFLDWQETFEATRARTSVVLSTCIGILFGGAILPGYVMSRLGARCTLLLGSVFATTGLLLSMFATSIDFLIATTGVVTGIGLCFLQLPVIPCVTMVFTRHKTAAISVAMVGVGIISVFVPMLIRYLISHYSWRGAFVFVAGLTLNTSVTGMIITSTTFPKQAADDFDENISSTTRVLGDSRNRAGSISPQSSDVNLLTSRPSFYKRLYESEWKFFTDFLFLLVILQVTLCVAVIFSFTVLLMDFARTSGFDRPTGLLFIMCTFASSIVGRLLVGLVDLIVSIHSVVIFVLFSVIGAVGLLTLSFITNRESIIFILCLIGVGLGGQVTIYPKCVLDMKSVTPKTYPIAYGVACSLEGILDIIVPIAFGAAADDTGSYTLMLVLTGCVSLMSSVLLACGYLFSKRDSRTSTIHQKGDEEPTPSSNLPILS